MRAIDYFVGFDTDQRVDAHPFDLLTDRSETLEMLFVVRKIEWYDVRLIAA